jgi:hypothetical protein
MGVCTLRFKKMSSALKSSVEWLVSIESISGAFYQDTEVFRRDGVLTRFQNK